MANRAALIIRRRTKCPPSAGRWTEYRAIYIAQLSWQAVVWMDADARDDPVEAVALLQPTYEGRADLVIGSRTLGQVEVGTLKPDQVLTLRARKSFGRLFD